MNSPGSPRNDLINILCYLFRESDRPRTRLLLIAVNDRGGNADQSGVGAVQAQRIVNQVILTPVFAGHHTVMRLVPIKDELFIQIFADDVQVDGNLASVIERQFVNRRFLRLPTRGWKTVSGGVNAGTRPLTPEVTDIQSDLTLRRREVPAIEIIRNTERVYEPLFQRPIGKRLKSGDLVGKVRERLCRRRDFSLG